jgi:uncharacterized protein (DUF1330 family)
MFPAACRIGKQQRGHHEDSVRCSAGNAHRCGACCRGRSRSPRSSQATGICHLEIEATDEQGYKKEYVPAARTTITESGGRFIVQGGRTQVLAGSPTSRRFAVIAWENAEKAQAWYSSDAYQKLIPVRDRTSRLHNRRRSELVHPLMMGGECDTGCRPSGPIVLNRTEKRR